MSKYLVSFGDSDKYSVDFPGTLDEFKNSDIVRDLKQKAESFLKEKFPVGNFAEVVPFHVEEAKGGESYPALDKETVTNLLKNIITQVGVENFTDKLNLNAPFDKL